jgi:hypothetical protein
MTVIDLIEKLNNCPKDALVILTVGNEDTDLFSSHEFHVNGENENLGYVELYMDENARQQL